jgi:hypothetical protein
LLIQIHGIFEDYLTQLNRHIGVKSKKKSCFSFISVPLICSRNTTFLRNIKVVFSPANCTSLLQPVDLGIIHAFMCSYRSVCVCMCVKLDVSSALHFTAEAWKLITNGHGYNVVSSNFLLMFQDNLSVPS